jgi:hypothetical protein
MRGTGPFFPTRSAGAAAIILCAVPQSKSASSKSASTKSKGRYTAPPPKKKAGSPLWFGVAITTCLVVGLLIVVTNYIGLLPGDAENRYLIVGLIFISLGFMMATGYH